MALRLNPFRKSSQRAASAVDSSYLFELVEIDEHAIEPPSRWFGTQAAASELGLKINGPIGIGDLVAANEMLGPVVELQFTAPVSVSSIRVLHPESESSIDEAHQMAVDMALAHLGVAIGAVPIAAQFIHSFARLPQADQPPPQLHTHALLIAVDMDEDSSESVTIGPPGAVPPPRASLGFVPDDLDRVAQLAYDTYLSQLTRCLQQNFDVDNRGEIRGVPDGLRAEFAPKPCGMGAAGRAIYLSSPRPQA